jgi:hypothetical protein
VEVAGGIGEHDKIIVFLGIKGLGKWRIRDGKKIGFFPFCLPFRFDLGWKIIAHFRVILAKILEGVEVGEGMQEFLL